MQVSLKVLIILHRMAPIQNMVEDNCPNQDITFGRTVFVIKATPRKQDRATLSR